MGAKYKTVTCGIVCESAGSVNRLEMLARAGFFSDFICIAQIHG